MATKGEIKEAQRAMNKFCKLRLAGIEPLIVDGIKGPATNKRVIKCKYYLGYTHKRRTGKGAADIGTEFVWRCLHPRTLSKKYGLGAGTLARGARRRTAQRKHARDDHNNAKKVGVGTFDGKPCAKVAIAIMQWCRKNGWHGRLSSGWRSAAYSTQLCEEMCGHPTCPGRCAGATTNHTGETAERFAIDVTDYVNFGKVVARCPIKPRIFNALPADPVHFSPTGH